MTRSLSPLLTWIVGIAALIAATIKAATCGITHDEAVTYALYVDGAWLRLFENYTAGNHVLFSVLARLSTAAFGTSEIAFRLPSLAAAAVVVVVLRTLLLAAAPRIAALGMAAILWNPLVLDNLASARGYALSLACFLVALRVAARPRGRPPSSRDAWIAGAFLGLSIAANLTAVLPAAACGAIMLSVFIATPQPRVQVAFAAIALIVPAAIALLVNLAAMGWEVGRHHFWYGTSSVPLMMASFDQRLLFHEAPVALVPVDEVLRGDWLSAIGTSIVSPMLWAAVVAGAAVAAVRRSGNRLLIACGGVIVISIALIVVAHAVADVRFLRARTGMLLVVTMLAGATTLAADLVASRRMGARVAGSVVALVLAFLVVRALQELRLDRLGEGHREAHARATFLALETLRPASTKPPLRILAHAPVLGPGLDYYRLTRAAVWMAPVDRVATPGVRYDGIVGARALAGARVVRQHFREIARDDASDVVVLAAR